MRYAILGGLVTALAAVLCSPGPGRFQWEPVLPLEEVRSLTPEQREAQKPWVETFLEERKAKRLVGRPTSEFEPAWKLADTLQRGNQRTTYTFHGIPPACSECGTGQFGTPLGILAVHVSPQGKILGAQIVCPDAEF